MAKSLSMVFTTDGGKKVTFKLNNVKDTVTATDVTSAMNAILSKNLFATNSGNLKAIDSAELTDKNITSLTVK
jgi:phospholipase/lecithinase/hemolysin